MKKKIAIVSGSYRPPHKGHLAMVEHYSKMADEVIVLISSPKIGRKTKSGNVIDPNIAKQIFDMYTSNIQNVKIKVAPQASPIAAAYEYVRKLEDVEVIFGASAKDNDWHTNWRNATKFVKNNCKSVSVIDPEKTAVPAESFNNNFVSSSAIRNGHENAKDMLPEFLTNNQKEQILRLI